MEALDSNDLTGPTYLYRWSFGRLHDAMARNLRLIGKPVEAEDHARRAIDHFEAAVLGGAGSPNHRRRTTLLLGMSELGAVLYSAGKRADAVATFRRAIARGATFLREDLKDAEAEAPGWRFPYHVERMRRRRRGRGARGYRLCDAPRRLQGVSGRCRGPCPAGRGGIVQGWALERRGDHDEAARAYRRAIELGTQIVGERPDEPVARRHLAASHLHLAEFLWSAARLTASSRIIASRSHTSPGS